MSPCCRPWERGKYTPAVMRLTFYNENTPNTKWDKRCKQLFFVCFFTVTGVSPARMESCISYRCLGPPSSCATDATPHEGRRHRIIFTQISYFFGWWTGWPVVFPFLSEEDLKPPPYSECAHGDEAAAPRPPHHTPLISQGGDSVSVNEAPPPYTPSPPTQVSQQAGPVSHGESQSESRST